MSRSAEHAIILTHDGKTDTLTGWATRLGISRQTLHARLQKHGKDLDRVLISGTKKLGRPTQSATQSVAKLDGLTEILSETMSLISVNFSSAELQRLQEIKDKKFTHQSA